MIERLDSRIFLDATLHYDTGELNVAGTTRPDAISFDIIVTSKGQRLNVTVNGQTDGFTSKLVKLIRVEAGAGADAVTVGSIGIRSIVDGGKGNDTLIGGDQGDKLIAGGGSNTLMGAGGNDTLIAGLQADSILGEGGDDTIIPDNTPTADDTLSGGSGFDVVDYSSSTIPVVALVGGNAKGNQANDDILSDIEEIHGSEFADTLTDSTKHPLRIFGGGGNDTLTGGSGNDTLDGGSGLDSLLGLGGKDHFRTKDGKIDTVDGGSGVDFMENSDNFIVKDSITNVP